MNNRFYSLRFEVEVFKAHDGFCIGESIDTETVDVEIRARTPRAAAEKLARILSNLVESEP